MTTLTMTRGLPGSGKTQWAIETAAKTPGTSVVCKDDLRDMLHNGKYSRGNEKIVLDVRDITVAAILARGNDVIVADTNFAPQHEEVLLAIAINYGATFVVKDFTDVPLATCLARDAKRDKPVGSKVIRGMWEKYLKPPPPVWDPTLPTCIIVDMDGTLAIVGDRSPYADDLAYLDTVNETVAAVMAAFLMAGDEVGVSIELIIMSGRDEGRSRLVTSEWIKEHIGLDDDDFQLYMRPAGDIRKDSIVKRELYEAHIVGKYNVQFWMDDRNQVVDMVRDELGLTCLQVAAGDF